MAYLLPEDFNFKFLPEVLGETFKAIRLGIENTLTVPGTGNEETFMIFDFQPFYRWVILGKILY